LHGGYTASALIIYTKYQRKNTWDIPGNQILHITPYSKDITQPTATHEKTPIHKHKI
jgi:hypothetical protein